MTIDNWLMLAMVISTIIMAIATLLAPVLAVLVEARINQPTQTPVVKKPVSRIRRIASWPRKRPGVFALMSFLINLTLLILFTLNPEPLTRPAVVLCGLIYTTLLTSVLFPVFLALIRRLVALEARQRAVDKPGEKN